MRFLLAVLIFAPSAFASQSRYPFDSSTCSFQGHQFEVKLDSIYKAGDPNNDSGGAQFVRVGHIEAEKRSGKYISDGAYTFLKPKEDSFCEKTQAYALGGKYVAILYLEDNRPFQEKLHMAVYDPVEGRLVKVEKNLGPLDQTFGTNDGFAFSNLVARSDADTITTRSPWGKDLTGSDRDLDALRRVRLEHGEVKIAYDPDLSYEKSPWKDFYDKEADYLADAGWNAQTGMFKNVVVYEASYFSRKEGPEEQKCIGMTARRQAGVNNWRCRKITHE